MFFRANAFTGHPSSLYRGLRYWLTLDQQSGATVDSSGYGISTTLNGATRGITGKRGYAYDFDGTNDNLVTSDSGLSSALSGSSTFTISFWAESSAFANLEAGVSFRTLFESGTFAFYPYYNPGGKGGNDSVMVWHGGSELIEVNHPFSADGTWHHYLFVSNSSTDHKLYVDGVERGSSTSSVSMGGGPSSFYTASWDADEEWYTGGIDNVKAWDRALSLGEIELDYKYG